MKDQSSRGSEKSGETEPAQRIGHSTAMHAELRQIVADPSFRKSPTLTRLLKWLVEQTNAGQGDKIKSYSVAVQGLGKAADFDTQTDSYPRVQVGRLRKALESYYAHHGPTAELCLYLQQGSYRVRMGRLSSAYPKLYRPLATAGPLSFLNQDSAAQNIGTASEKHERITLASSRRWMVPVGAAVLIVLFALFMAYRADWWVERNNTYMLSASRPVVMLDPMGGDADSSSAIADGAFTFLADGLSRSWLAQVRTISSSGTSSQRSAPVTYRLEGHLNSGPSNGRRLYLRLHDVRSSALVWSTSVDLIAGESLSESLAAVIAELVGPFGVIAQNETRLSNGRLDAGYPCLLGYLSYLMSRQAAMQPAISKCLSQPSPDYRLEAVRLALLANDALDNEGGERGQQTTLENATAYSRQAIQTNPNEAYAHFAFSRTLFVVGDCAEGLRHSEMAAEANPYDPIVLAVLGALNAQCGHEAGERMLDQAFRLRVDGASYARLSLILGYIVEGRLDRLAELSEPGEYRKSDLAYHHLCETLIAATIDDRAKATGHWTQFLASSPEPNMSPDKALKHWVFSPRVRAAILQMLAVKGILQKKQPV